MPQQIRDLVKDVEYTCSLSSFIEFCSAVANEKSKMSQSIRDQGGHLGFRLARETLRTSFMSSFVELRTVIAEEK